MDRLSYEIERAGLDAGVKRAWVPDFAKRCMDESTTSGTSITAFRKAGRKTKEYPNGQDYAYWEQMGQQHIKNYIKFRHENRNLRIWTTPDGTPAIEIGMKIPFPGGVPVKMFIDRIFQAPDGTLIVVDLKTGARIPDSELQLGFYAAGIELLYGKEHRPGYGAYMMTKEGDITAPLPLDMYTPELIGSWLVKFDDAVQREIFLPHVGPHCRSCGVIKYCAAQGGTPPDVPATP